MKTNAALDNYIDKLVKLRGLTTSKFSEACHISNSQAHNFQKDFCVPTYATLQKIKVGLDLTQQEYLSLLNYCQLSVLDKWRSS